MIARRLFASARAPATADAALLLLRVVVGGFLVWGVWDNIVSAERMAEFAAFLAEFDFPAPSLMAPLSVYAQFFCGAAFVLGVLTRAAGVLCAINFTVAIIMVDRFGGVRASFPSAALVALGLYIAANGPGRFSLAGILDGRR